MSNETPVSKVQEYIEQFGGLSVTTSQGTIAVASECDIDDVDEETGEMTFFSGYQISYHNGMMPAFETDRFETLQELADSMQELEDLLNWDAID